MTMAKFGLRLGAFVVGVWLLTAALPAQDQIVGAVWEITFMPKKGKPEVRTYRATPDGKVYNRVGQVIGTHTSQGTDVTMVLNGGGPLYNGTFTMTQVRKDPPSFAGRFLNSRGAAVPIKVRLVRD
jgi:hypothetical protein